MNGIQKVGTVSAHAAAIGIVLLIAGCGDIGGLEHGETIIIEEETPVIIEEEGPEIIEEETTVIVD